MAGHTPRWPVPRSDDARRWLASVAAGLLLGALFGGVFGYRDIVEHDLVWMCPDLFWLFVATFAAGGGGLGFLVYQGYFFLRDTD